MSVVQDNAALELQIGQTTIPYKVRQSPQATRKRIVVTPEGVEVVVPAGTSLDGADGLLAYVHGKRRWVFDSVRELEDRHNKVLTQKYASGAKLQYRGRWLMLDIQAGSVPDVQIVCRSKFHVTVPKQLEGNARLTAIRSALNAWLRTRALRDLRAFGRHHEEVLNVVAEDYRLSDAKARWGSLGRDGIVRVHWRLIQAPKPAMEYVVAHEIAHLIHRNHSPEFWAVVTRTMPDWTERKAMLERWETEHRAV